MGVELYKTLKYFGNTSYDKVDFYKKFNKALYNVKNICYLKFKKSRIKYIPGKYWQINKLVSAKERENGGHLTDGDRKKIITLFMDYSEYLEIDNMVNTRSLDFEYKNNEGENTTLLDSEKTKNYFHSIESVNKFNIYPNKICEAVEHSLQYTRQGRKREKTSRECKHALFTLYIIKETPDYKDKIYPVLDKELIDAYKNSNKELTQCDIYLKYHPERISAPKKSIEANASGDLSSFFNDIELYLLNNK